MATKKHAGGRPTKLTAALIKKAQAFVDERKTERSPLPTVEGLALELGISRDTVYEWSTKPDAGSAAVADSLGLGEETKLRDQFSDIVSDLKNAQGEKLVQNGLTGRYNATIAKLILSGKHGYVEKSATDLTSDGKALAPVLVKFVGEKPGEVDG